MTLAHTIGGPGGLEIELLLVAFGFLAAAFFFRPSQEGGSARTMFFCLVIGVAMLGGAVAYPRLAGSPSQAQVEIVTPQDGATVPANKPVTLTVNLTGGSLATDPTDTTGGHLHVFVDNKVQSMPSSERIRVSFEPGAHEVRIEYVDNQHLSFDTPVVDSIDIEAS